MNQIIDNYRDIKFKFGWLYISRFVKVCYSFILNALPILKMVSQKTIFPLALRDMW